MRKSMVSFVVYGCEWQFEFWLVAAERVTLAVRYSKAVAVSITLGGETSTNSG